MNRRIPLLACQRRLLVLWCVFAIPSFVVLGIQTEAGVYGGSKDPWEWFLPHVMPTLSLLVGVVITNEVQKKVHGSVSGFLAWFSGSIAATYLLAVLVIILAAVGAKDRMLAMKTSNLFLAPVQGIVAAVIGALFVSSHLGESPDSLAPVSVDNSKPTAPKPKGKKNKHS